MKLYSNSFSPNCRKTHGVITHLGLSLEKVSIDLMAGEQKQPEFLAKNPNGMVPVLEDDTVTLFESNAILGYLCAQTDTSLWPKTTARYSIMQWLSWEQAHLAPSFGPLLAQKIFGPMRGAEFDQEAWDEGLETYRKRAAALNSALEGKRYLVGDSLTIADFAVGVWFGYADVLELPLDETPSIKSWLSNLGELPAWKEVVPPSPAS